MSVRTGMVVQGLATGPSVLPGVPHVVGLCTTSGEVVSADLVLDAGGRRSALPSWLAAIGARPPETEVADNGLMYYTRYFRTREGCGFPVQHGSLLADLPYMEAFAFPADNGVFSVTFQVLAADKGLRGLRTAPGFMAAARAVPRTAPWVDPDRSVPITAVTSMAKLEDCYRRFVVDGVPVATGVLPVGDAAGYTNPALGRGTSLAFVHARLVAESFAAAGCDYVDLARRLDEAAEAEVVPWFRNSVDIDRQRVARMAAVARGEPVPEPDPGNPAAVLSAALRVGSAVDPVVFAGFARIVHLVARPDEVFAQGDVLGRALAAWERRDELDLSPQGPERTAMVDLVAQAS